MTTLGLRDLGFVGGLDRYAEFDTDAKAYLLNVEAVDGFALELGVANAVNAFVIGCKTDGIWSAIKASCILAGARTLNGALVPLVGAAPARQGTEGGWSYNRKTGLKGNGSNNYINTNRLDTTDPQNSFSQSVYLSEASNGGVVIMGSGGTSYSQIGTTSNALFFAFYNRSSVDSFVGSNTGSQFIGSSRSASSSFSRRYGGNTTSLTAASAAPNGRNLFVFADNNAGTAAFFSTARLSFYQIGESLNLALLDSRVITLINAIAAAIP